MSRRKARTLNITAYRYIPCTSSVSYTHLWLEKIVAENDPYFIKPRVDKSLKAVQAVCYYGVEKFKDLNRTEI